MAALFKRQARAASGFSSHPSGGEEIGRYCYWKRNKPASFPRRSALGSHSIPEAEVLILRPTGTGKVTEHLIIRATRSAGASQEIRSLRWMAAA